MYGFARFVHQRDRSGRSRSATPPRKDSRKRCRSERTIRSISLRRQAARYETASETGNFSGAEYRLLGPRGPWAPLCSEGKRWRWNGRSRSEGRNEFGDVCRKAVRIDKSWGRLFDGDLGLSIEDSKTIMAALQSAVVNHEAETYSVFRRVCPIATGYGRSRTTRRDGSGLSLASWRCAILVGCCVGIVTQAWSMLLRRCGRSARIERHPS